MHLLFVKGERLTILQTNNIELIDSYGVLHMGIHRFIFDIDDLSVIRSRDWYMDKDGYLASSYFYNGRRRFIMFHREVMHANSTQWVDHINRDKSDNRKCNLRCCKREENNRNRGLFSTNTSGVTGVFFDKERGKWVANISYNKKRIHIGRYASKDDAIMARLEKEIELFDDFAPQRALYNTLQGDNL